MRRADMDTDVWYAINTGNIRHAGRIIDPGTPGTNKGKVLVVVDSGVYFGGSRDDVRGRLDRLADYTDEMIVSVALDWTDRFTSVANLPKRPYYPQGDPRYRLEAHWVDTSDIDAPAWEYAEQVAGRIEAAVQKRVDEDAAVAAKFEAFAARWRAVADVVDIVWPGERMVYLNGERRDRRESEIIAELFSTSADGRRPHLRPDERHYSYEQVLSIFEAWAADRATVAAGPVQCRLAV